MNIWQVFREWQDSEIQLFREHANRLSISWPVFQEWQRRSRSFEALTVYQSRAVLVDGPDTAEWVRIANTTRSFPDVLGTTLRLYGSPFTVIGVMPERSTSRVPTSTSGRGCPTATGTTASTARGCRRWAASRTA